MVTKTQLDIKTNPEKVKHNPGSGQLIAELRIPGKNPKKIIATSVRSSVIRLVALGLVSAVSLA